MIKPLKSPYFMMAPHRNAYLSSKLFPEGKSHFPCIASVLGNSLQQDGSPWAPKHSSHLCMSGLEATAGTSQSFPHQAGAKSIIHGCLICSTNTHTLTHSSPFHCAPLLSWFEPWGWTFHWNLLAEKQTWSLRLKALSTSHSYCICSSWPLILLEMFSCIISHEKKKKKANLFRDSGEIQTSCDVKRQSAENSSQCLHFTKIFGVRKHRGWSC